MKYLKTFENKYEDNDFDFITTLKNNDMSFYIDEFKGDEYDTYETTAIIKWKIDFGWFKNPKNRNIGEGLELSIVIESVEFIFNYNILDENGDEIETGKELKKIYTPDNFKINIEKSAEFHNIFQIMPNSIYLSDVSEKINRNHIDITF